MKHTFYKQTSAGTYAEETIEAVNRGIALDTFYKLNKKDGWTKEEIERNTKSE